ncbi:MAG: glycosyltransferase [Acidobacteria bacterium]|nr:glycosyltransferase [Acidobacteriota bacterium]
MSLRPSLLARCEGWFWEHSVRPRAALRALRSRALVLRRVLSKRPQAGAAVPPPPLVYDAAPAVSTPLADPAVLVVRTADVSPARFDAFVARQTERSRRLSASGSAAEAPVSSREPEEASFCFAPAEDIENAPEVELEALLLAAASEDLDFVEAVGPAGRTGRPLLRLPREGRAEGAIAGKWLTHLADPDGEPVLPAAPWGFVASGNHVLRATADEEAARRRVLSPFARLSRLPAVEGRRTALFLLPYLAIGGAERVLFDLLPELQKRHRVLVATLRPHEKRLGTAIEECRRAAPRTYCLGDWLPRPAVPDAVRHFLRRYDVETLVSWNGTPEFYDRAASWRAEFPNLRIVNQLFDHRRGWIRHYSAPVVQAVDAHLAVNPRIGQELARRWAIPERKIFTVGHGVRAVPPVSAPDAERRRGDARMKLGLPPEGVVFGTFIRMHPQKRPLDVVQLARKLAGTSARFLLVGGGPLDRALDAEIERDPPPNLKRLGFRRDLETLYDAIDVSLLASEYEGFPLFLLDGFARSVPCVVTRVGDLASILEKGGGIVAGAPGDLDALERAARAMLDPARRAFEGERAREAADRHGSFSDFVSGYEKAIFP